MSKAFITRSYDTLSEILTVSAIDADIFQLFSLRNPAILPVGDTRDDQVSVRSVDARQKSIIPAGVLSGRKVLVAGSRWDEDDHHLLPFFKRLLSAMPEALLIHVPHEPTRNHLEELTARLRGSTRFILLSALDRYAGEPVIIVDSVGKLLPLYASAHVAFIGGGFGQGVHNVLEAAVFGAPVVFGPRHYNSQEPLQLIDCGGGFVVEDDVAMERTIRHLLEDDSVRETAGQRVATFVREHTGTTDRVLACLQPYLSGIGATQGMNS